MENENTLREALLGTARKLTASNLNRGTTGNISVRVKNTDKAGFLITSSGIDPEKMTAQSMVRVSFDGQTQGKFKPSSEWRIHSDILRNRPEIDAVIHTHSMFATTIACMNRDIPPFHYMIAIAGGDSIRCAPYALFGSQALSDVAVAALENRLACLLSHHGMIALGRDLEHAFAIAREIEALCEQYWRIMQIEEPELLTKEQMKEVLEQFKTYGQWQQPS